ncbi:MAG: YggT family protein [Eubacteriales bacterium]|nr:YggT family protein [Eubacteriales bacterium]MDD4474183.1 YggT family protein [Eubacteriales bacterium]
MVTLMIYAILLAQTVDIIISILVMMLFLRIMIGLFASEGSLVEQFLGIFTEPVVYPVRKLLAKSEFFSSIPIDYSMQIALLALVIISFFLIL